MYRDRYPELDSHALRLSIIDLVCVCRVLSLSSFSPSTARTAGLVVIR